MLVTSINSFAQQATGLFIDKPDSFYSSTRCFKREDKISNSKGDSVTIKRLERRRWQSSILNFAVTKGGSYIQLDSIIQVFPDRNTSNEYRASNGVIYRIGDTILLGRGSAPNGDFRYLTIGGWGAVLMYNSNETSSQFDVGRGYSGLTVKIKRILRMKDRGIEKVMFTVGGGNITNYYLSIEDAIATCEVKDCATESRGTTIIQQPLSPADELLKFKKLLDDGAIRKEEYEVQKKKILGQ